MSEVSSALEIKAKLTESFMSASNLINHQISVIYVRSHSCVMGGKTSLTELSSSLSWNCRTKLNSLF